MPFYFCLLHAIVDLQLRSFLGVLFLDIPVVLAEQNVGCKPHAV